MAGRRFLLDDDAFEGLLLAYEAARGPAATGGANRLSVAQRADALIVLAGLNREGGWIAGPEDPAERVFLRHLQPVLAESAAMAARLGAVLADRGAPGRFDPPLPSGQRKTEAPVRIEPPGWLWRLREAARHWLRQSGPADRLAGLAGALLLVGPLVLLLMPAPGGDGTAPPPPRPAETVAAETAGDTGDTGVTGVTAARAPPAQPGPDLPVLQALLAVASLPPRDSTPRHLAEAMAGLRLPPADPGPLLAAMLARFPLPADRPLPRDETAALAVLNWAAALAEQQGDRQQARAIAGLLGGLGEGAGLETGAGLRASLTRIDPRLGALTRDPIAEELAAMAIASPEAAALWRQAEARFGVTVPFVTDDGGLPVQPETLNDAAPFPLAALAREIRLALDAEAPLDGTRHAAPLPWPRLLDLAPLALPLAALLWALASLRRAVAARAWRPPPLPPRDLALVPGPGPADPALSAALRLTAAALLPRRGLPSARLDDERTIRRSLAQGGFADPVWRPRQAQVSHLLLVRRRLLPEHEPRRMAGWLQALVEAGLPGEIYEYTDDPTRLVPFGQTGRPPVDLARLQEQAPLARLLLFTTAEELGSPARHGALSGPAGALCRFDERAILTPRPRQDWGLCEHAAAMTLGCPIGHFGAEGPPSLRRWFGAEADPTALHRRLQGAGCWPWLAAQQAEPSDPCLRLPPLPEGHSRASRPPGLDPDEIPDRLRGWLGPQGFGWLGACASYPVLRYPLTLWLGQRMVGDPQLRARGLAQLCRLPWFATGQMPGWLRQDLRAALDPDQRARIEAHFSDFYRLEQVAATPRAAMASADRVLVEPDPLLMARDPALRTAPAPILPLAEAPQDAARAARRAALAPRALAVVATTGLAGLLWLVWPDRLALPLAPGAWIPVLGTLSAGMAAMGAGALLLRPGGPR